MHVARQFIADVEKLFYNFILPNGKHCYVSPVKENTTMYVIYFENIECYKYKHSTITE